MSSFKDLVFQLLDPIPQYVSGCLPGLAIMGESPANTRTQKLTWLLRCLGCPFTGLFYAINVGGKKESRVAYWLSSNRFVTKRGTEPEFKPFGFYACEINIGDDIYIKEFIDRCTAKVSILEIFSACVSGYFTLVGVMALISKATGTISCTGWPYLPSLLSWTLPAIWRRIRSGNTVIKDPDDIFEEHQIRVVENHKSRSSKRITVFITAAIAIFYPWITLLLAYFSRPIGYGCRSKFITLFCGTWSLNSILAFICHVTGEKSLICHQGKNPKFKETISEVLHIWFAFCGAIVFVLLIFLAFLTKNNQWWVDLFGNSCSVASIGC
ncbi:924_t:CDS:1 [Acaulospora morrowiae]|uniref:924_t:CDS:1 n=1 Tax=Acaulospora morrowiae TaxID=94023 RepID=A0A9N9BYC1_9GLOM|nr:924_t:CDS:1 [Acaulospora morrowiae]